MPFDPQRFLRVSCHAVSADRLAGLGPAQFQHMLARRVLAEIVIEGHHAVNLGPRQVQILRDDRQGSLRHIAKFGLNGMKDRQKRPLHPFVGDQDFPDPSGNFDRIKHMAALR